MRYQHEDKKIPQWSVSIMSPYNIQIENSVPSYKCRFSFFEVLIKDEKWKGKLAQRSGAS